MNKSLTKATLIILCMSGLMCACSGKTFRSPIVFRSPVVADTTDSQIQNEIVVPAPRAAIQSALDQPTDSSLPADLGHSPAGIPVLSDQDLAGKNISTLGRISVDASPQNNFSRDSALQILKVEAFKRYGSMAEGIINVNYLKDKRVSGEIIIFQDTQEIPASDQAELLATTSLSSQDGSNIAEADRTFAFEKIQLLSSEDLYQRKFKVLGEVSLRDRSKDGLTEQEVIRLLKIDAFRKYGTQAHGLTNLSMLRKQQKFFYTKVRKNISTPDKPDTYEKASAEVIVLF